jgi:hypothetical protein
MLTYARRRNDHHPYYREDNASANLEGMSLVMSLHSNFGLKKHAIGDS